MNNIYIYIIYCLDMVLAESCMWFALFLLVCYVYPLSLQLMLPVRRNDAAAGLESTALPSKHWACVVLAHVSLTREPHCQPQKVYNDMLTLDLRMCIDKCPAASPRRFTMTFSQMTSSFKISPRSRCTHADFHVRHGQGSAIEPCAAALYWTTFPALWTSGGSS